MLWDRRTEQVDCLGPAWLRDALPGSLLRGHVLHDLHPCDQGSGPTSRSVACLILAFGPGCPRTMDLPPALDQFLAPFRPINRGRIGPEPREAAGLAPELVGVLHLAIAVGLSANGPDIDEAAAAAVVEHLRRAMWRFETGSLAHAVRRAELLLERAQDALVAMKQLRLPEPVGAPREVRPVEPVGLLASPLAAIALPRIDAASGAMDTGRFAIPNAERELLGTADLPAWRVAEWLAHAGGEGLAVSLRIGAFRASLRPAEGRV
jgi:hypothetical protein